MSKYNGYTEIQKRAYKKYMNDRAVFTVRMTKEEKRILEEKAKAEGKSINQYILDKCL